MPFAFVAAASRVKARDMPHAAWRGRREKKRHEMAPLQKKEKTRRRQRQQRAFRATSWNNHSERSENVTNDRVGAVEEFAERRE